MYASKAGFLLQGGVHFDFFVNCGICSFYPSHSWKNSFSRSLLKKMLDTLLQLETVNLWWFREKWKAPREQILFGTWERDFWNVHYHTVIWFSVWLFLFVMFLFSAVLFVATFVPEKMLDLFSFLVLILVYYFSSKTIDLSYGGIEILPIMQPSSKRHYLLSKDRVHPSVTDFQ